jgi:Na+-translocating ferredoxin:NAD+ oxidoreductase subunit B
VIWLRLALLLVVAIAASFGASFFSLAWKRRKQVEAETLRIEAMLPGYDCGLCGQPDCRSYAAAIDRQGADPALCGPGGSRLESRLRSWLSARPEDPRRLSLRAVVRCGGREGLAARAFPYDGRRECRSAAEMYGGPKSCKEGCLGLGSCVEVCPRGAIRVAAGLACISPSLCTGCGECAKICPNGVISLVPREQLWYVACSSTRAPAPRKADCAAACTACRECSDRSNRSEFFLEGELARENAEASAGHWAEIAAHCPSSTIVLAGSEKRRPSPFRRNGR